MITSRNTEPSPYSGSNVIDHENTSPFFFPNWFSRSKGKHFGGWREELLIWKLLTKPEKQTNKKIHSMFSLWRKKKDHFSHGWTRRTSYSFFLPCLVGLRWLLADFRNLERTRLVPLAAITDYNCRNEILVILLWRLAWAALRPARGDRLPNLQWPTRRPLLPLQEGQRRKITQIKETGNSLFAFCVCFWFFGWQVLFCWVEDVPALSTVLVSVSYSGISEDSVFWNIFLLISPTFFTTLNLAQTFSWDFRWQVWDLHCVRGFLLPLLRLSCDYQKSSKIPRYWPAAPCSELQHLPQWQGSQLCLPSAAALIPILETATTDNSIHRAICWGLQTLSEGSHQTLNPFLALART